MTNSFHFISQLFVACSFLAATAVGATSPGYVGLPLKRTKTDDSSGYFSRRTESLVRRAEGPTGTDHFTVNVTNIIYYYTIPLGVGTSPQFFEVLLDTGSSDMMLISATNPFCEQNGPLPDGYFGNQIECSTTEGLYYANESSTYQYDNSDFFVLFGDGTAAEGDYVTDNVYLVDSEWETAGIQNVSFAVATVTNASHNILGLGLADNERSHYLGDQSYGYQNFPAVLKDVGLVGANAYALYLSSLYTETATILFGAVDSEKYTGGLWTVPLVNYYENLGYPQLEFTVMAQDIVISAADCDSHVVHTSDYYALLDSGTTYSYLPQDAYEGILENLNATYSSEYEDYLFKCKPASETNVTYYFSGVPISVSLYQSIFAATDSSGNYLYDDDGDVLCNAALGYVTGDYAILGQSFLRGAYVVFDLDNLEISLGEAVYTTDTNIEIIDTSVPGAKPASEYVATTDSSCTSTTSSSSSASTTSTASSTSSTSTTSSSSGASTTSTASSTSSTSFSIATINSTTTSAALTTSGFANSTTTASTSTATFVVSSSVVSTSASAAPSSYVSTQIYTSVSGTLTITGTHLITVCPVCEGKETRVSSPAGAVSATTTASVSEAEATTEAGASVIVTVIDGITFTIPCAYTASADEALTLGAESIVSYVVPTTSVAPATVSPEATTEAPVVVPEAANTTSITTPAPVAEGAASNIKPVTAGATAVLVCLLGAFIL